MISQLSKLREVFPKRCGHLDGKALVPIAAAPASFAYPSLPIHASIVCFVPCHRICLSGSVCPFVRPGARIPWEWEARDRPIGLGRVMRVHAAQSQDVFVEKVERAAEASSIPHHVREQQIEWHSLRHEIEHVVVASVESPSHRQAKCFPPRAGTLHPWYSDADAWLLRQRCSDGEFIICARTDAAGVPDPWRKLHI